MKFIFAVGVYNAAPYIGACIASVRSQTQANWRCVVMDDCSTDGTADAALAAAGGDERILVVRNPQKKFLLGNMAAAIELADPDPEDVMVCLDGDDFLSGPEVLTRLSKAYAEQDAWLTYGSYETISKRPGRENGPYPAWVRRYRQYRWARWRASQLKTVKVWLWRAIRPEDLTITPAQFETFLRHLWWYGRWRAWWQFRQLDRGDLVDPSGKYFRRCVDKVIMFPLLEMAGEHAVHIPDILYVYRDDVASQAKAQRTAAHRASRYVNRCIRTYLQMQKRYRPIRTRSEISPERRRDVVNDSPA